MGLFDLPAPLFEFVDRSLLGALPPLFRLVLWAVAGAVVSLALYRGLSPQRRIAEAKVAALDARRRLNAHDGDLESALPLMRQSMKAALQHVGLVFPAAIAASLPVLALLVWLDAAYGHQLPKGSDVPAISVQPAIFSGHWQPNGGIDVRDQGGVGVAHLALAEPVTQIEKRQWWNVFVGNPAGYLPEQGPVERVTIALPERQYLSVGPDWLRSWAAVTLTALVITSLLIMRIARIA